MIRDSAFGKAKARPLRLVSHLGPQAAKPSDVAHSNAECRIPNHEPPDSMRIISFNANGIRSATEKGFFRWFARQKADVLCL